jgi:hypothetical protein
MRHSERRCEGLVQLRQSIIVVIGLDPATSHVVVMLQEARAPEQFRRTNANRFKLENDDEH